VGTKYNKVTKYIIIFIGYLVVTIITTWPVCFNINNPIGPPEDNQMFIWNIWWFKYAIFDLHVSPFNTDYLFYPQGASLYFHTYSPLNNLIGLLLQQIFSLNVTYNIMILLTLLIGAMGGYFLLKYFGLGDAASFIGGLIYSFNPFHLTHISHHLNISSIHLIPFLILFSIKYIDIGHLKYLILSGIFLALNLYLDHYIFLFSSLLLIFIPFFTDSGSISNSHYLKYVKIGMVFILGIIFTLPLLIPMIKEILSGNFQTFPGIDFSGVDLTGFFFPYRDHWTGSSMLNYLVNLAYKAFYWESAAFMGYLVFPMAMWSILKADIRLKKYLIVIGIFGAILSLGSVAHIFGLTVPYIRLPMYYLAKIPGLNAARSPSRFIFLTYFSISILAAYAVDKYLKYLKLYFHKWVSILAVIALTLLVLVDYSAIPFKTSDIPIPKFFNSIRNERGIFAVLNLPQRGWDNNERYMYYQTIHQKPICNGQLARSGEKYFDLWENIPIEVDSLSERKVKYIVLYSEFFEPYEYFKLKQLYTDNFNFIGEDCGISFFKVY